MLALKALAVVPHWYKYRGFFFFYTTCEGKSRIFPAMHNEITIAMQYSIT